MTPLLGSIGPSLLTEKTAERTSAPSDLRMGTVTEVTRYGVTVDVAGGLVPASHLDSYSPAVGHTVVLQRFMDAWVVLGRSVGTGTATDSASAGGGMGATILDGIYTEGGGTIASSTGATVPVPGYTLTLFHPPGHVVMLLLGYSWYSTQSADYGNFAVTADGTTIGSWVAPIITNFYGRYDTWQAVAGPEWGGVKRIYQFTMARLGGTGTTTVSKTNANRGFFIAVDLGDQTLVRSA